MGSDDRHLPSRLRFAKSELVKLMTALENVDPEAAVYGIRLLEVEDQLADAREDAAEWRRRYHALKEVMARMGGGE